MKILHISDLHLGKKINGYSLLEDQRYFLDKTIDYMNNNEIKHLIIAGDIYDVSSPAGEAINTFSEFLNSLKKNNIKAFIIAGNHDSNDRVGYGSELIRESGIYINSDIKKAINPISVDGINYYLIPYANVTDINSAFNQSFSSYEEAMAYVISLMELDKAKVNIAVSHQLVLPGNGKMLLGGSEEPIIGTISNISSSVYKDFNYTALGHIHRPQVVGENIRYSGSPLAYHIDETKYDKEYVILNVVDGKIEVSTERITPLREVVELTGTFESILTDHPECKNYYVYATITGSNVENAMAKLKSVYPYAVSIRYAVKEVKGVDISQKIADIDKTSNEDLFAILFNKQTKTELSEYQKKLVSRLLEECEENEAN